MTSCSSPTRVSFPSWLLSGRSGCLPASFWINILKCPNWIGFSISFFNWIYSLVVWPISLWYLRNHHVSLFRACVLMFEELVRDSLTTKEGCEFSLYSCLQRTFVLNPWWNRLNSSLRERLWYQARYPFSRVMATC